MAFVLVRYLLFDLNVRKVSRYNKGCDVFFWDRDYEGQLGRRKKYRLFWIVGVVFSWVDYAVKFGFERGFWTFSWTGWLKISGDYTG